MGNGLSTPCLCRRALLTAVAAAAIPAVAVPLSDHVGLHATLGDLGALDNYLQVMLSDITGALAAAYGVAATVNAPPPHGGIMVVVLRAARDRPAVSGALDVPPDLLASPMADPLRRIVWIDADFLRRLVMRISLFPNAMDGGGGLGALAAVAESEIAPPPERSELWRDDVSPAVSRKLLTEMLRGACAFILAHEMAHILAGPAPALPEPRWDLPRRARQVTSACPELIGSEAKLRRAYEEQADARALEAVLSAGDAVGRGPAGLPGELGIVALLVLAIATDLTHLGSVTEATLPQLLLRMQIGSERFVRLRDQSSARPATDTIRLLYSDTHPASTLRLAAILRELASRSGSTFKDKASYAFSDSIMLGIQGMACDEASRGVTAR